MEKKLVGEDNEKIGESFDDLATLHGQYDVHKTKSKKCIASLMYGGHAAVWHRYICPALTYALIQERLRYLILTVQNESLFRFRTSASGRQHQNVRRCNIRHSHSDTRRSMANDYIVEEHRWIYPMQAGEAVEWCLLLALGLHEPRSTLRSISHHGSWPIQGPQLRWVRAAS